MREIPLICTTTIEIPLILEIQRTRKVYICLTSRSETEIRTKIRSDCLYIRCGDSR